MKSLAVKSKERVAVKCGLIDLRRQNILSVVFLLFESKHLCKVSLYLAKSVYEIVKLGK